MATAQVDTVVRHFRQAVLQQDGADRTDAQLLVSFIDQKDEAAFAALIQRHGPMVFGVCRRVVRNYHDTEDAFQATFLVLARKAACIKPRERLVNWLHGVALRTAMKSRAMRTKRQGREKQVTEMPEPEAAQQDQRHDLQPLLDQELNGLPENYRLPMLLCDLGGKTIKEAARQLGWPQGTMAGRLDRGRKLLAKRLTSRGVVLSATSLAAMVSQNVASAGMPALLMSSTVTAAIMITAEQATVTGVVPATVASLMEGVMKSMMLTKLTKKVVVGLVVLCLCGLGIGGYQASPAQEPKLSKSSEPQGKQEDMNKSTAKAVESKGREHQITVIVCPSALPAGARCQVILKPETNEQNETVETVYEGKLAKACEDGIILDVDSVTQKVISQSVLSRIPVANRLSTSIGIAQPTGKDKDIWVPAGKIQTVKLAKDGKLLP